MTEVSKLRVGHRFKMKETIWFVNRTAERGGKVALELVKESGPGPNVSNQVFWPSHKVQKL